MDLIHIHIYYIEETTTRLVSQGLSPLVKIINGKNMLAMVKEVIHGSRGRPAAHSSKSRALALLEQPVNSTRI